MEIEKLHHELHRSHIPSYTSDSTSHMVDFILALKEETHVMVENKEHYDLQMFQEDQSIEFMFGERHTFMEEVEKHTIDKPTSRGVHASTCLVDESYRGLVHSSSSYSSILATSTGNEDSVKGFFLVVSHEGQEAPTVSIDDCRIIPCDVTCECVLVQKDIEESLAM